jgi:hypothetical protein
MLKARHAVFLLALMSAAAGCASKSDVVDMRMLLPPPAERPRLVERQHFIMAAPIRNALPVFPEAVPTREADTVVCVEIVVSEHGDVPTARIVRDVGGCGAQPGLQFEQQVLQAVRSWSFFAAALCEFPQGIERNEECEGDGVMVRAVPIKLTYAFTFSRKGGRKNVAAGRAPE